MIGMEIVKGSKKKEADPLKARTLAVYCLKKGVILLADGIKGNVLSITPSLTITEKQLNYCVQIIQECLKRLKN
jgi:4-aminobutyrate aminotransferase/(S)-3-amino-2-methylpropionate transaminase